MRWSTFVVAVEIAAVGAVGAAAVFPGATRDVGANSSAGRGHRWRHASLAFTQVLGAGGAGVSVPTPVLPPCSPCSVRAADKAHRRSLIVGEGGIPGQAPCSPCMGENRTALDADPGAGGNSSNASARSHRQPVVFSFIEQEASHFIDAILPEGGASLRNGANSALYWISVYSIVLLLAIYMYTREDADAHSMGHLLSTSAKTTVLPRNLWALNLIAAIGQVKVGKQPYPVSLAILMSMFIGTMQIITLFLVVHDIDPDALPITSKPSSPWKQSTWTINLMKWLMVVFLSIYMSKDAAEARTLFEGIMETNKRRLTAPRILLMAVCFTQYIIIIMVVWCGVSAVLSFQAVPDILYSSMAVTFLSHIDEAVWELFHEVCNVKADFVIVHGRPNDVEDVEELFNRIDADGDGTITREELQQYASQRFSAHEAYDQETLPVWLDVVFRVLVVLPVVLGFGLIFRAFMTNVMPTKRVHFMKQAILDALLG